MPTDLARRVLFHGAFVEFEQLWPKDLVLRAG